jgi:broad specificity phosphatase PhoE
MKKCIDTSTLLVTLCMEVGVTSARRIPMATWIAAVRHPQKEDDIDGIYRGDAARVTEEGERQISILIERAQYMDLDAVVSSDTPRTALLAERIGHAINRPVITDALFREWRRPSFMHGMSAQHDVVKQAKLLFRESFDRGMQHFDEETRPMLEGRTLEAMGCLMKLPPRRVLLASHANFICGMVCMTVWGSLAGYYRGPDRKIKLDNTGVTIFALERDRRDQSMGFVVQSVNDVSHQERAFYSDMHRILGAAE